MKYLTLIIASSVLLYSCKDKKSATTETEKMETLTPDSTQQMVDSATTTSVIETPEVSPEIVTTSAPVVVNPTPTVSTKPVAVKSSGSVRPALNPAHGEPYHRCDIQVGAPIDSPSQQNVAPQTMPQQANNGGNFNTNPISPSVAPSAPATAVGPKPALNPAHGEPHHRCDLQVGAPLT